MSKLITLKKAGQKDLQLFKNCLQHYSGTLEFLTETMEKQESYVKDISIATELWYDFNKKTAAQYPAVSSTVNMPVHKAFVLRDAVCNYSSSNKNELEKSRCNRYYTAIDDQLPTATMISSNFKLQS